MEAVMQTAAMINRANQLNPNNIAYWMARGFTEIPAAAAVVGSAAATTGAVAGVTLGGVIMTGVAVITTAKTIYDVGSFLYNSIDFSPTQTNSEEN